MYWKDFAAIVCVVTGLSLIEETGNQWNGLLNDVTLKVFVSKSRISVLFLCEDFLLSVPVL